MRLAPQHLADFKEVPLVAILRGLDPISAQDVGAALMKGGFRAIEVPLNRPGALDSIAILARTLPEYALVGGGTMLSIADVDDVHEAGGRLMVSPNCNEEVISRALSLDMFCAPGVATPTEAFRALAAGAHALKIFPAETVGYGGLNAYRSVLPPGTALWPVGGITTQSMKAWVTAGATGFGLGSQIYTPGTSATDVFERAVMNVKAWRGVAREQPQ